MLVLRHSTSQASQAGQFTRCYELIERNEGFQDQVECGEVYTWESLKPTQRRGGHLEVDVNDGHVGIQSKT